jgi:hypothetical protein
MVYKSKAQMQAELTGMAEALLIASFADEDEVEGEDFDMELEDKDEWQLDNLDPKDDVLGHVALRVLELADSMSGNGSRGPYNGIVCSKDYFPALLQQPDQRFRYVFRSVNMNLKFFFDYLKYLIFRLSRSTFDRLVALLANNPIFTSRGKHPQRHVKFQLAAFLMRYGRLGSSALSVAMELSIGEGTVFLYCK